MEGYLKIDVDIIKYDGTNKDEIISKLQITSNEKLYFEYENVYFIVPKYDKDEWFILNEDSFKQKIITK